LPIRDERFLFCKRQDLPKIYKVDGNIFIFNINSIIAGDNLYLQPCKYVLNDIRNGIDIDTIQDFQEAESLLIKNKNFIE
jgi:CMP-N-acetylneuraminic acid synthetase